MGDGIFEPVLSVNLKLQKTKMFMSVTGCAYARGLRPQTDVPNLFFFLNFEVDGISSRLSYQELFYVLYFLSYSRLKMKEGCQIQKKSPFGYLTTSVQYFFIFFSLVTCKIKRSVIWFKWCNEIRSLGS